MGFGKIDWNLDGYFDKFVSETGEKGWLLKWDIRYRETFICYCF